MDTTTFRVVVDRLRFIDTLPDLLAMRFHPQPYLYMEAGRFTLHAVPDGTHFVLMLDQDDRPKRHCRVTSVENLASFVAATVSAAKDLGR